MVGPVRDASQLEEHGTLVFELPAGAIVGAAVRDLSKRETAFMTDNGAVDGEALRYAFVAAHVRAAKGSVQGLIARAIKGIEAGQSSGKLNTRRIYRSLERLQEAKDLAQERGFA